MRRLAAQRGLDPDKWFNNVEVVTADKIGLETSTYVRNIYKYYTAYKLVLRASAEQQEARGALTPAAAER
jgi:membrane-bound lytic murein transglycosylase MltF